MNFEKIYWVWKKFESKDRDSILKELDRLVEFGENVFTSFKAYGVYNSLYNLHLKHIEKDFIVPQEIINLFKDIKNISQDAYYFLTDGFEIINLVDFLKLEYLDDSVKAKVYIDFIEYTRYLRYIFKRIINENDEEKKKIMLRGILGI